MSAAPRVLVTGAGGFIGHHLVTRLRSRGCWVRGVDLKPPEFSISDADEFLIADLRSRKAALRVTHGIDHVYALAADMGGMGYISANHSKILHNNTLIDLNTIHAAARNRATRYFYASSACVYPMQRQSAISPGGLREQEAFPADPEDAYGWEKLTGEKMAHHYAADYGLAVRVARFHNIYGPEGTWTGGREKAPAAISRKVAEAALAGRRSIEIWGDGLQTRSFCFINDCLDGIERLMASDHAEPLNIGSDRDISINDLADMVAGIAGVTLERVHVPGPQGVRGRNSDNTRIREVLGWAPSTPLEEGMAHTYRWIEEQVRAATISTAEIPIPRPK